MKARVLPALILSALTGQLAAARQTKNLKIFFNAP